MKIHAYILCYNEERIIRSTLSHYDKFCSRIFLMDNMSTDLTLSIAKTFDKVTVIPWSMDAHDGRLYIKMKAKTFRDYSRRDGKYTEEVADWIIACDADEILYHPHITSVLQRYMTEGVTVPQVTGFNMIDDRDIDPQVPITQAYRRGVRSVVFDKRIIFSADFDMQYSGGSHPQGPGFEQMKKEWNYRPSANAELAVLHYKHIGGRALEKAEQYLHKWKKLADGQGQISAHYHSIISGELDHQRDHTSPPLVIADDGTVNFNDFEPTSGETGIDCLQSRRGEFGDTLRDLAARLEQSNLSLHIDDCISLMEVACGCRPHRKGFKKRLERYQRTKARLAAK